MAKPIKSLELHYPMIQFLIIAYSCLDMSKSLACDGYQPVYIIGCQKSWREREMPDSELFIK